MKIIFLIMLSMSLHANVFFSSVANILNIEDSEKQMITTKTLYCVSEFSHEVTIYPIGTNLELGQIKYECTDNIKKIDFLKESIVKRNYNIYFLLGSLYLFILSILIILNKEDIIKFNKSKTFKK